MPRLCEMRISPAPTSTARHAKLLPGLAEVEKLLTASFLKDQCSYRHGQHPVHAGASVTVGAFAVAPAIRAKLAVISVAQKSIFLLRRLKNYVATVAPVASARAASRHVLLTTERDAAIPAVAAFDPNFRFVNKHVCTFDC